MHTKSLAGEITLSGEAGINPLVDLRGFEPLASAMRTQRSPN